MSRTADRKTRVDVIAEQLKMNVRDTASVSALVASKKRQLASTQERDLAMSKPHNPNMSKQHDIDWRNIRKKKATVTVSVNAPAPALPSSRL